MAKRKTRGSFKRKVFDFGSWNFIIFLVLAFILLVTMLGAMMGVSTDVRSKAGLICPKVTLPRAEDCSTGWKYQRDPINGCPTFLCTAN
jgi:hypothetical protein